MSKNLLESDLQKFSCQDNRKVGVGVYLNNAATTARKPPQVLQAVREFHSNLNVSPGRGTDLQSGAADSILNDGRLMLAKLFNIKKPLQIVFTLNCSDALNTALKGTLKKGDHAIVSPFEHNSMIRPLRELEKNGIELTIAAGLREEGIVDPISIKNSIRKNTKLIGVLHASNVMGGLQPIEEIGSIAKESGIMFLVDAAQTAGAYNIDVEKNNIGLLAFAGHKSLMGPQGTGGLYIKEGLNIDPLRHGGTGSLSELEIQPEIMPDKFETGTPNTPGIAGLNASIKFILKEGVNKIQKHGEELTGQMLDSLKKNGKIRLYGPGDPKKQSPVISFNIEGLLPAQVSRKLEKDFGIIVRPGLHCSPVCHKTIGTFPQGTVRISIGYYNTEEEIETVSDAINKISGA